MSCNQLTIVYNVHIQMLVDVRIIATTNQWQKPAKNPMQKLPKKPTKTLQKPSKNLVGKNPAKIFYENINKKSIKIYKNFVILISKQNTTT
jgi:hypothetical protein